MSAQESLPQEEQVEEQLAEELVLEMEHIVTEEELLRGNDGSNRERNQIEQVQEQEVGEHVEYTESSESPPPSNAGAFSINEEKMEYQQSESQGPLTRQRVSLSGNKVTGRKLTPVASSGPIPPDAKVVVLMKSNVPGEKPTFVKLEPVAPPPTRLVPSEFSRAIMNARRRDRAANGNATPEKPTRKRRIIPPVVKKDKDPKKLSGRRGRPPKDPATPRSQRSQRIKQPKSEPSGEEEAYSQEGESSGRPKRIHKTPKRYGDFYEPPPIFQDQTADQTANAVAGIEPEAEEAEADVEGENPEGGSAEQTESSPAKKLRVTADVVSDDDYEEEQEDEDEEESQGQKGADDSGEVDEGEVGSAEALNLKGKEYEEYVANEVRKGKLQCEHCHRFFANHNSMNAHRFKVHKIVVRASVKCPGCEHRATTIHTLNEHVALAHGLKLQYVNKRFASTTDFQNYLDNLAATQNMAFVRHRKSDSKRQLYCNRSGAKRVAQDPHIRNRPRKGTAKIGAMCPAHMFYTECEDGSIEVNGQLTHFGHTLDPRYVFPVTSSEKVTSRMKPSANKRAALESMYGRVPVDLQVKKKSADEESFINVETDDSRRDEEMEEEEEYRRLEEEARLEEELGPVHPKAEEIDIRMKNIDRLCSFLFDNVSEQLYRLDDTTMDVLLRSLRTTQNSISNLNSMMIQIKEGDPNVIQKYQRRGPKYSHWGGSMGPGRPRKDGMPPNRRRQRQLYDTEDYDEDTVYYRHVPLRSAGDLDEMYLLDEGEGDYYEGY